MLYASASVQTDDVRTALAAQGLVFTDPGAADQPDLVALRQTADALIARAIRRAGFRGAVAGSAGALALPPEVVAAAVQSMRLGQRLAVVYGHRLETDRGKLVLGRAMAAAFEFELPDQARIDFRVRQLPALVRPQQLNKREAARHVARAASLGLMLRIGRAIPGLGMAVGLREARRLIKLHGQRMVPVFEAHWQGVPWSGQGVEEAMEA